MKQRKNINENMVGKDAVFQGSGKHRGKIAKVVDKLPSGNYTIEFEGGPKLTEVPEPDLRFLEPIKELIESDKSVKEIIDEYGPGYNPRRGSPNRGSSGDSHSKIANEVNDLMISLERTSYVSDMDRQLKIFAGSANLDFQDLLNMDRGELEDIHGMLLDLANDAGIS